MKILVKDLREVTAPKLGRCVRFSVTLAEDDGEPLMTQEGFMIDNHRVIRPPATRGKFGKLMSFVHLSREFQERLKDALEAIPSVPEILGVPVWEGVEKPDNKIDGETEV